MDTSQILDLGRQAVILALQVSLPVMLFGLVAGVLVSAFQAVTQIQEMTLSYVPKILAVVLALFLFGNWMLTLMVDFTTRVFTNLPPP